MILAKDFFFRALGPAILTGLVLFTATLHAEIPDAPHGYVTDLAEILNDGERQSLEQKLKQFEKETSTQIFVLIAPDLDGSDEFTATFETASKWGVGQAGKDNGILIALYMADRKIRIEVGYGLEGSVPDALASQIIRNTMVPHMRDGAPFLAIDQAVDNLIAATKGEYTVETTDAFGASDADFFEAAYMPPWVENLLAQIAIAYFAISLIYAILAGFVPKFDQSSKRFRFGYDVTELLSEWIAHQIIVAILIALPVGVLFFIVEEFKIHGFWVLFIGGGLGILYFLRAFFSDVSKNRRTVRELTGNLTAWRKLENRFDAASIERLRGYFAERAARWRPGFIFRPALEELKKNVERALNKPEKYFAYTEAYARKKIAKILEDESFWQTNRETFDAEQVNQKLHGFQSIQAQVFSANGYDAAAGEKLLNELTELRANPEAKFDYSIPACTALIQEFLDDNALWAKWRMRSDYVKSRVNTKQLNLRARFKKLQERQDDSEKQTDLNELYKKEIKPLRANPAQFFKRVERTASSSSSYSSSSSSYSGGSGFSSFSSSSSFSGGGGGSFGGGGASGSW